MKNKFQTVFEKQLTLSALFFGLTFAAGPIEILIADPIYRYALKFTPELYDTSSILFKNFTAAHIMLLATIIALIYSKVTQKISEKGFKALEIQAGIECGHFILCIMYFMSIVPPLAFIGVLISIYGLFLACTRYNYAEEKQRLIKRESQGTINQTISKEDIMNRVIKSEDVEKDIEKINQKEKSFLKTMFLFIGGFILVGLFLEMLTFNMVFSFLGIILKLLELIANFLSLFV